MQKHIFTFLFFIISAFIYSDYAQAALQFLPRYQGSIEHKYKDRTQDGGKDKVSVTCATYGGYAKGANQTCSGVFYKGGLTCYKSCACSSGYTMNTAGTCVAQTCKDYGLESSPVEGKSCPAVSKAPNLTCYECTACDTATYKYACSGGLNASTQKGTACNKLYSECTCVANAEWKDGACTCKEIYKYTCSGGLNASTQTGAACNNLYSECSCVDNAEWKDGACTCKESYKYACADIENASGGEGAACGNKYAKCKCKTGYYWDNGSCGKVCDLVTCTGETSCGDKKCTGFSSVKISKASDIGDGVADSGYKACEAKCGSPNMHGYVVTACKTDKEGWSLNNAKTNCECTATDTKGYKYTSTDCANASCNLGCNDKYKFNSCNSGYYGVGIGSCPVPQSTDCALLGYKFIGCLGDNTAIACPFDKSKVACF